MSDGPCPHHLGCFARPDHDPEGLRWQCSRAFMQNDREVCTSGDFCALLASSASASHCRYSCCGGRNLGAHHLLVCSFLCSCAIPGHLCGFYRPVVPSVLPSLRDLTYSSDELVQRCFL